ncbi:serine hydrolase [Bradyrhizobium aeschynomenes]|uniref:serine hydrolase n=1 Tax=Bradyrhizobium aeschynomenes TaxID=2734909 RepID=UPI001555A4E3|nr:serine hydrolase [Bradyrhizobium aeschynomenes]NPV19710.1 serine hydrolase [Bradyrhizobium aeschynomenes]
MNISVAPSTLAAITPDLDALAAEAMLEWKIPAVTLAVVLNGETTLLKAYGDRDVEAHLPATPQTQFTICSITKTFTATALAMLVGDGRLDWGKPVRDYIPEFRLHDPVATERVTVRDLLSHHSGLPRHDWIWMPGGLSPAETLAAMRHIELSRDVRTTWQYSNLGYFVAGLVIERISGQSWEDFIRSRITDPLKMAVTMTVDELAKAEDAAAPYIVYRDERKRTKLWPFYVAAAAGINTSAAGLANWMTFLLAEGEFEDRRLISAELVREMQKPLVPTSGPEREFGHVHYGLGFNTTTYRDERIVGHSGGWLGWSTLMRLVPERKLGVAALCNVSGAPVPAILINRVIDHICGKEPVPWLERLRDLRRKAVAQAETDEQTRTAARKPNAPPAHPLSDYVGSYQHPAYGRITITSENDGLHWAYRCFAGPLAHRHYETFETPLLPYDLNPDRLALSFHTDRDGNVASLSAQFEPLTADIVFQRAPGGDCMDTNFRASAAGSWRHGATTHVVTLQDDGELTLKSDFQPLYRLRPYQGGIFSIVELEGFRVEFRRGTTGEIDELAFHQPNGTFIAHRIAATAASG